MSVFDPKPSCVYYPGENRALNPSLGRQPVRENRRKLPVTQQSMMMTV